MLCNVDQFNEPVFLLIIQRIDNKYTLSYEFTSDVWWFYCFSCFLRNVYYCQLMSYLFMCLNVTRMSYAECEYKCFYSFDKVRFQVRHFSFLTPFPLFSFGGCDVRDSVNAPLSNKVYLEDTITVCEQWVGRLSNNNNL